jgi:hypothetical protein
LAFVGYELAHTVSLDPFLAPRVTVMHEDNGKPGIRLDNKMKRDLVLSLNDRIQQKKIKIYKKFFTTAKDPAFTPKEISDEIINQLINYSRILKRSNNVHEQPKEFYGGKLGHGFDDLAIAVQINNACRNVFYASDDPVYKRLRS